eukprot:tig00021137_g18977.t1
MRVVQVLKPVGDREAGGSPGSVGVPEEARRTLASGRPGFRFVSVLGPTRTGKSYLSNCIVGTEGLFDVQNRDSLTVGIDTNEPALSFGDLLRRHEISDVRQQPEHCSEIRFLDTEGMGNREAKYDLQVVLPSIAAASVVVVNFSGRLGLNRFLDELSQPMTHLIAPLISSEARAVDFISALTSSIGSSGALDFPTVMQALYQAACARARAAAAERWRQTANAKLPPLPVNAGTLAAAARELAHECERLYESEAASAGVPSSDREEGKGPLRRELAQWAADVASRNAGALRDFFAEAAAKARAELRGRAAALRDAPGVLDEAALREKAPTSMSFIFTPELKLQLAAGDADASAFACPEIDKAIQDVYRAAEDEGMVLVQHMAVKRDAAASRALMGAERALREALARLPLPMGASALGEALAAARQAAGGASPRASARGVPAGGARGDVPGLPAAREGLERELAAEVEAALRAWGREREEAARRAAHASAMEKMTQGLDQMKARKIPLLFMQLQLKFKCFASTQLDNRRLTEDLEKMASEGQKRLQSLERQVMEAAHAAAQRPMLHYGGGGGGGGGWDMCSYSPGPGRSSGGGRSSAGGGRTIYTGPRGGQYYINSNGNKSYLRR